MRRSFRLAALLALVPLSGSGADELTFKDDFKGKLAEDWSWVREEPKGWRVTELGLEVRVQPGNMWGPANDAKNVLTRPAPDPAQGKVEVAVTVENRPTEQYEQVDLVWYYDDSHMVKIGQEMVDGKLSIVMGREESDKTRTMAIIPLDGFTVRLRLTASGKKVRGQFRRDKAEAWREAGECDLPVHGAPKVSLQFYQGPDNVEHGAKVTRFRLGRVVRLPSLARGSAIKRDSESLQSLDRPLP